VPSAKDLLQRSVKGAAAGADVLRRPPPGVVVLIYHRVGGGSGTAVDLAPELFDEQMAVLAEGRSVVTLEAALTELAGSPSVPAARRVVITFDDGTADFVDVALPILERHRLPATLYAATAFIDGGRAFPDDGTPVSWSALRDACATGLVDVGSHTHSHQLLDRLPPEQVPEELDRSIELIGEQLGREALDFAYPKALLGSPAAERAVRARFRSAAVAGTHANRYGATDPHRLARSPVQVGDGMTWFRRKVAGGMGLEDDLRRIANRRRYASATT
jgi:peptidoglycan/xylan/chitin deacetylase (PgdA/CDA1 family)